MSENNIDFRALLNDGEDELFLNISESNYLLNLNSVNFPQLVLNEEDLRSIDNDITRFQTQQMLNDGYDYVFNQIHSQIQPAPVNTQYAGSYAATNRNRLPIDIQNRINYVQNRVPIARVYLENHFFKLELWPSYMIKLFIQNNIAQYSYIVRNKIYLFFWGNGGTYEIMLNISSFYAPRVVLRTREEIYQFNESCRKCLLLFDTYSAQLNNPNYARSYYYYSIIGRRMLFLDGTPRHFGERQEIQRNH